MTAPKPWRRRVSRSGGVPLGFVTDAPQLAAGSFTGAANLIQKPKVCHFYEVLYISCNSLFLRRKIVLDLQHDDKRGISSYGELSILLWIYSLVQKTANGLYVRRT